MGSYHSSKQDTTTANAAAVSSQMPRQSQPLPSAVNAPTQQNLSSPRNYGNAAAASMPAWLHLLRVPSVPAEGEEQYSAATARIDRHTQAGRPPVTAWERICLSKAAAAGKNQSLLRFQPSSFIKTRNSRSSSGASVEMPVFEAEDCRACASRYTFKCHAGTATIVLGRPTGIQYQAISYVWGQTRDIVIKCKCGEEKVVPMASAERFSLLLSLAAIASASCEGVWLDALSIDQDSHADKNLLLNSMGDIYKGAQSVLVLFTVSDKKLFSTVASLRETALLQDGFEPLNQHLSRTGSNEQLDASQLQTINKFVTLVEELRQQLDTGTYFRRAWTMQEWALGQDLHITCERSNPDKQLTLLRDVKSTIIRTAVRIAIFVRTEGRYAGVALRGPNVAPFIDHIKELFPNEDVFRTREEVNWQERIIDGMLPFTGLESELGLVLEGHKRSAAEHSRARLHFMLNTFSTSTRHSRYEADAVACWASMCNLQYDYNREDKYLVAQKKAIDAARQQGTTVYNFQANIPGMSGEMHVDWLMYAYEQQLRNATHETRTVGAPCFTGIADFAQHLSASISPKPAIYMQGRGVRVIPLVGPWIASITPADSIPQVVEELRRTQTGHWSGAPAGLELFHEVEEIARANLQAIPREHLYQYCLVLISLQGANTLLPFEQGYETPATVPNSGGFYLSPTVEFAKHAWAFVPKSVCAPGAANLAIGREALNGTLVLARRDLPPERSTIVGYLTGLDFMSGVYLLPVDGEGKLDLTLHAPQRSDIVIAAKGSVYATRDRRVVGQFEMAKGGGLMAF